ncbi:hypothetical protein LV779_34450 [Streptomyces thinghirensis]|nr:hypothetical protein [Streptomyces thinghirensis]
MKSNLGHPRPRPASPSSPRSSSTAPPGAGTPPRSARPTRNCAWTKARCGCAGR